MDKQTLQSPKLVNPKYFKVPRQKVQINPEIKRSNSWYLNVFLIVTFLIIMIFFLLSCKYGMFKSIENEPLPYSVIYNKGLSE